MIDIKQSRSQRVPTGVSVARPITANSIVRAHALALQHIVSGEDILFHSAPFRNNAVGYSFDNRKRFVAGS